MGCFFIIKVRKGPPKWAQLLKQSKSSAFSLTDNKLEGMKDLEGLLQVDVAAVRFGFSHRESLRRRLRQLRKQGKVVDLGKPPLEYEVGGSDTLGKVLIFWSNSKTALIRSDVPQNLLDPRQGKRSRN